MESDKLVIKTVGLKEFTDKLGNKKTSSGNLYLHYLTKCLKSYDNNFTYGMVIVPRQTKEDIPEIWKAALRKKGIRI